jgi:hypothetical protein
MMLLARLTGRMIVVLAAVIVVVRVIGGQATIPFAGWFNKPDGTPCEQPCLFGLQIGTSTSGEIRDALRLHPLTKTLRTYQNVDQQSLEASGDNVIIQFYQDRVTQRLGSIFAEFSAMSDLSLSDLPLSAVINVLGPPDTLYLSRDNYFMTLVYSNAHLEIGCFRDRSRFSFESRCYSVYLDMNTHFPPSALGVRWLGFSSMRRYLVDQAP